MTPLEKEQAVERASIAIADSRGIAQEARTYGMMAVFRADADAVLSSLPTPTREEVARIVAPHPFRQWQGFYEYCLRQGDDEQEARKTADWAHGKDKEEALGKADAILQLIGKGG
jgi:hypothetical protein